MLFPIHLLLVDDDRAYLDELSKSLERDSRFDIVVALTSGSETLHFLRKCAGESFPLDVVLSDVSMPSISGLDLLQEIRSMELDLRFLAMTAFDSDAVMLQALLQGADGYVIKADRTEDIAQSIIDAMDGGTYLSPQCLARLLRYTPFDGRLDSSFRDIDLSPSEMQVFLLLSRGYSNREIGDALGYADSTVKKHVGNLLRYFGVKSRVQLALIAVRMVRTL